MNHLQNSKKEIGGEGRARWLLPVLDDVFPQKSWQAWHYLYNIRKLVLARLKPWHVLAGHNPTPVGTCSPKISIGSLFPSRGIYQDSGSHCRYAKSTAKYHGWWRSWFSSFAPHWGLHLFLCSSPGAPPKKTCWENEVVVLSVWRKRIFFRRLIVDYQLSMMSYPIFRDPATESFCQWFVDDEIESMKGYHYKMHKIRLHGMAALYWIQIY